MYFHPVAYVLSLALTILYWILIAYFVLSWLEFWQQVSPRTAPRINTANPVVRFIERVSYTIVHPIRRVVEPYQRGSGIDFSIIIAFLIIYVLQIIVAQLPF